MTTRFDENAYKEIEEIIAPEAIARFLEKGRDYKGAFAFLGVKGQFSDINRKFWKLKSAIWDDQKLHGEQPYEIVEDFLGHCLLMLYMLRKEQDNG